MNEYEVEVTEEYFYAPQRVEEGYRLLSLYLANNYIQYKEAKNRRQ